MADTTGQPYAQILAVLQVVLTSGLFNGKGESLRGRTLNITTEISDFAISARQVRVHPAWAASVGPLEAAKIILDRCEQFNSRLEHKQQATWEEWQTRMKLMFAEVEKRWGAEGLQEMVEGTLGIGNDSTVSGR